MGLISLERRIANDDAELHVKLRRDIDALTLAKACSIGTIRLDILQVVALMELLFPVKFAIFSIENNLMEMIGSNPFTFATCYTDEVGSLMQPVIFAVTIVSIIHVHKKVVNTKSDTGTFIKGKGDLPNWLVVSTSQCDKPEKVTVCAMIRDWQEGLNYMFPFEPGSSIG